MYNICDTCGHQLHGRPCPALVEHPPMRGRIPCGCNNWTDMCVVCTIPAEHKVASDDHRWNIHPLTNYLCCGCFGNLMGDAAREWCNAGHPQVGERFHDDPELYTHGWPG